MKRSGGVSSIELRPVVLSIAPEFAELLYGGFKRHEYRRVHCRLARGQRVYLYESRSRRRVTGSFVIDALVYGGEELADLEFDAAVQARVRQYLEGARRATAIRPAELERWPEPRALADFGLARPPQSYQTLAAAPDFAEFRL